MNTPMNPSSRHPQPEQPGGQGAQQPAQPAASERTGGPTRQTSSTRVIVAVTAAVGGLAVLGIGASAAYASIAPNRFDAIDAFVGSATGDDPDFTESSDGNADGTARIVESESGSQTHYAVVDDVRSLDLDIAAAGFELAFGDVSEAELVVAGDRAAEWKMAVDEGELSVETPDRGFTTGCLFNCGAGGFGNATATLTLPQSLSDAGALEADVTLAGGALRGAGAFRSIDVDIEAGELSLEGSAERFAVDVEAGKAEVDLADVATAEIGVEAGSARVSLTGAAPARVSVEASAGSADLELPEADYRVDAKTELGELDDRLSKDADSKHVITVRAEAAKVTLQ